MHCRVDFLATHGLPEWRGERVVVKNLLADLRDRDSGFGLLGGEVGFLTATLVVIDMTLAGLFWAMSNASGGGGDDVIGS